MCKQKKNGCYLEKLKGCCCFIIVINDEMSITFIHEVSAFIDIIIMFLYIFLLCLLLDFI